MASTMMPARRYMAHCAFMAACSVLAPHANASHVNANVNVNVNTRDPALVHVRTKAVSSSATAKKKSRSKAKAKDAVSTQHGPAPGFLLAEAIEHYKRTYEIGSSHAVTAHFSCQMYNGTPPLRGYARMPFPVRMNNARILCLAEGRAAEAAIAAGAQVVGTDDHLLAQIVADEVDFTCAMSTVAAYPKAIRIAKYLGPRGMMPSVKKGTVVPDDKVADCIRYLRTAARLACNDSGDVECTVGMLSQSVEELNANMTAAVTELVNIGLQTQGVKVDPRAFIRKMSMSCTWLPAMPIDPLQFMEETTD